MHSMSFKLKIEVMEYAKIKSLKVKVLSKIGPSYPGEVIDVSPNNLPWKRLLVRPLGASSWAISKWVSVNKVEVLDG